MTEVTRLSYDHLRERANSYLHNACFEAVTASQIAPTPAEKAEMLKIVKTIKGSLRRLERLRKVEKERPRLRREQTTDAA